MERVKYLLYVMTTNPEEDVSEEFVPKFKISLENDFAERFNASNMDVSIVETTDWPREKSFLTEKDYFMEFNVPQDVANLLTSEYVFPIFNTLSNGNNTGCYVSGVLRK